MRSRMRVPLTMVVGAVLALTGMTVAPGAVATPDVAPPGDVAARVTAQEDDVVVNARISLPAGTSVQGSITGTLSLTHNGSSATVRSGHMTLEDPTGRELVGEEFVASGTTDAWTSTVPLPDDAVPGVYGVTLTAQVDVTTDDGVFTVPIRITDPVEVPFRAKRNIPKIWLSPAGALEGAKISVSGVANMRSLSTGENSPAVDQQVKLYFDPAGTAPEELRATLTTDDRGFFTSRQTPGSDGKWRMEMPQTDSGARTVWTLTSTETDRTRRLRQGAIKVAQDGFATGDHLSTQDVVIGTEAVQRRVDVGSLGFAVGGTSGWVSAESREGGGSFPDGYRVQEDLVHSGLGTSHAYITFRPTLPAGIYDIGIRDEMKACSAPDWDGDDGATSNCTHDVLVEDPTVTTIVVKRASTTAITASRTSFTGPKTITLSGSVHTVQPVSTGGVANRAASTAKVKLYFDPAGSAAPVLKKTVTTDSDGKYTTSARASSSGRWIAKYAGTDVQAPSQKAVSVTVK